MQIITSAKEKPQPGSCPTTKGQNAPLAVDLDGTLTFSDTLHESLVGILKKRPGSVLGLYKSLRLGKAPFKRYIAENQSFDATLLPYNKELVAFLRAERQSGRKLGLFTAADQSIADAVGDYLDLFDIVRGSNGIVNLSEITKAAAIKAAFGPNFAYAGDSIVDLSIFAQSSSIILVGETERLRSKLHPNAVIEASFPALGGFSAWIRAMRFQHWAKNALVFVAAALAPFSASVIVKSSLLFVLMGILASANYIINDILDLTSDRNHPIKCHRPFASGAITVKNGILVATLLILVSLITSLVLPFGCTLALSAYLILTLIYSLLLKHIPMMDVTVLAGLFTLRVLAGSLLLSTPISPWLLTFSMFFFFGLAIIKRYAELERLVRTSQGEMRARGYTQEDRPILLTSGLASGFSAIVIFMIYLIDDQYPRAFYNNPAILWAIMPVLLIWTLRLWHLAVHGRMSEDPVMFALRDRLSLVLGAAVVVILIAARG